MFFSLMINAFLQLMLNVNAKISKFALCIKHSLRAENGTRTRDPNLGKVVLYQLSYFRL